jgi:hypothetical protein
MAIKLNSSGSAKAGSLVSSNKIHDSGSWSAPSSEQENAFIKAHNISEYGSWHLGVDSEASDDTKGKYSFPFSSDFKTVDFHGLRACETRAAQNGHDSIAARAKSLYEEAKKKLGKDDKKSKAFKGFRKEANGLWVIE